MKLLLILLVVPVLMSETCKNKKNDSNNPSAAISGIPACIQQKIDSIKKVPRWNPPAEVNEYNYNGKRVFLFSSDCCDFFNPLLDSDCNYVCAPSGGISGQGDIKCSDFKKTATHIKLVWKDPR